MEGRGKKCHEPRLNQQRVHRERETSGGKVPDLLETSGPGSDTPSGSTAAARANESTSTGEKEEEEKEEEEEEWKSCGAFSFFFFFFFFKEGGESTP